MTGATVDLDGSVGRWWGWFAVALFLLVPLDLLTTLLAIAEHGHAVEANPIMQWLLHRGLVAVTAVNLLAVGFVVYLFHAAIESFRQAPPADRRKLAYFVNAWIGILLVAGIALVANNIIAIL